MMRHIPRVPGNNRASRREAGIALIVVIIALLLITAVAAGMIIYANSEINIDANYKDSQVALYAAKAGLEEARDRMLGTNANTIALPSVLPLGAGVYATYLTKTGVTPWLSTATVSSAAGNVPVYDTQFLNELGLASFPGGFYASSAINTLYSGPAANPLPYQWVRVNLKIDRSAYNSSGTPYYVDGTAANAGLQVMWDSTTGRECVVGVGSCAVDTSTLSPVYEVTSFAVTPAGTRRMLQDEVTAVTFNLTFPSALTLPGPIGTFNPANSDNYCMDGYDGGTNLIKKCSFSAPPAVPGCAANAPPVPAIGLSTGNDAAGSSTNVNFVDGQIPRTDHYIGSPITNPSVTTVSLPTAMSTPAQLDQELQMIYQNANVVLQPSPLPANGVSTSTYSYSDIVNGLGGTWPNSSNNPQVVYVDGNLDISGNTSGSGILVVTGNLTYDGNSSWNGIILVVGDGTTTYQQNGGGNGQFNGALFVATTRDANGNQLSNFGPVDFNINGGGGNGLYYNSCWINNVQKPVTYKVLSTKEIE